MTRSIIKISAINLWEAYAPNKTSGRVECPIDTQYGPITHLYLGYGALRLERITKLTKAKGFQGEAVYQFKFPSEMNTIIQIYD